MSRKKTQGLMLPMAPGFEGEMFAEQHYHWELYLKGSGEGDGEVKYTELAKVSFHVGQALSLLGASWQILLGAVLLVVLQTE